MNTDDAPTPSDSPIAAPPLRFTAAALEMARELLRREDMAGLRVGAEGGGCSGLQYALRLDRSVRADDVVLDVEGVPVFIDRTSLEHLSGTTIDYVHALHGAGFKFSNPNAVRTCGCGSSFAV